MIRTADISPCGTFRYRLGRSWGEGRALTFIMLNPSTADAEIDDPTIRRCISFAKREGYAGANIANVFPLRATDPKQLSLNPNSRGGELNADGYENEIAIRHYLIQASVDAAPVVCAWGAHFLADGAAKWIMRAAYNVGTRLVCLGKTKDGFPRHPLYVRGDMAFEAYP